MVRAKEWHRIGGILFITLVLALSAFLLLYHLSAQPFQDDEALYAQVTSESLASHNFLTFTDRGELYFNKPPLEFWLMDLSRSVVPDVQEAQRLPSALAGILLIAAVMLLVFEATKSLCAAGFGGLMLATTASFVFLTRSARFDSLVSLWIVLAVYAFIRAMEDRRWFLWFGSFIGLAVLTKGPLAIYAIIAVLGAAFIYKRFNWFRDVYFLEGVIIALLIAVPWHLYETILYGTQFWNVYLVQQLVDRVQSDIFTVPVSNAFYVQDLFEYAAPWSILFLGCVVSLPYLWSKMSLKTRAVTGASLAGTVCVLLVFFLTASKSFRYFYSLYPFMAVAISLVVFEISKLKIRFIQKYSIAVSACLVVGACIWSVYNGFALNPNYPYLQNSPQFLQEEKAVGEILLTKKATEFYVYGTSKFNPIIFYGHVTNVSSVPLDAFQNTIYITMPTTLATEFITRYSFIHTSVLYAGQDMVLLAGTYSNT